MIAERKFYIVHGKKIPLNRVESARFVSSAKDHKVTHLSARLAKSSRLGLDTDVPPNYLVVRGDAKKLDEIKTYPDVKCTRSVFMDNNGLELILTDEILVKFEDNITAKEREAILKNVNCIIIDDTWEIWRIRALDLDEDAPLDIANKLWNEAGIVFAEPNALQKVRYAAFRSPIDDLFPNQWHLHNTGYGGGKPGADVNALEAWEITYGSPDIRIVVHDTGVDISHPDLRDNVGPGRDFGNDGEEMFDSIGHGTACAGIIAAAINGIGVVGIAPDCKITPLKVSAIQTIEDLAKTFEWAAEHGEIISCSWECIESDTLSLVIKKITEKGRNGKGTLVIFATGNSWKSEISFPASLPETIAVGASTNLDVRAEYSNYGQGIDFVAPSDGVRFDPFKYMGGTRRIETTDIQGRLGFNHSNGKIGDYCKADDDSGFGGTSASAALAAGVAALVLSANPVLNVKTIRKILQNSCVKIDKKNANYDENGWSIQYGYGRIDSGKAVKAAATRSSDEKQG